jgi:diaminopimelate epimerase
MNVAFKKYQGTGNDFILIDDRAQQFRDNNHDVIARLCDRRFGIGADGLMLLRNRDGYDFEMVYFNSDGKTSSMCGNGGRCIARFAKDIGAVSKNEIHFLAIDGPHEAIIGDETVKLKMNDVSGIAGIDGDFYLNTGSPHYVKIELNVPELDVYSKARKIRYNERFAKEGTNVNFMEPRENGIYVRTYERGVEDETLSCGTGVTAAALIAALVGVSGQNGTCAVATRGGNLHVHFQRDGERFHHIWLEGPAVHVFNGDITL